MNDRPLPTPTADSLPYWEGAKAGKLMIPTCVSCKKAHFYPRSFCPHCGSRELSWTESSGKGLIYTFTVNHRAANAAMKEKLPYVVAVVELAEGPRIMTNLVDSDIGQVRIGVGVEVTFEKISDEISLPQFKLKK